MIVARDVCDTARKLKELGSEADLRAAISRFYYAALWATRALPEARYGYKRSNRGSEHTEVSGLLRFRDRKAGRQLATLRRIRSDADYKEFLPEAVIALNAGQAEQLATSISQRLVALGGEAFYT